MRRDWRETKRILPPHGVPVLVTWRGRRGVRRGVLQVTNGRVIWRIQSPLLNRPPDYWRLADHALPRSFWRSIVSTLAPDDALGYFVLGLFIAPAVAGVLVLLGSGMSIFALLLLAITPVVLLYNALGVTLANVIPAALARDRKTAWVVKFIVSFLVLLPVAAMMIYIVWFIFAASG